MLRRVKLIALGYLLAAAVATPLAVGQAKHSPALPETRFVTLDIYVDPLGQPLGAYQFELRETNGRMTVVGLENGEHPAFAQPPLYDRAAIDAGGADRVIAASYSLLSPEQLPTTRTRVATVHAQITGGGEPDYQLTLIVAGDADARPIQAKVDLK